MKRDFSAFILVLAVLALAGCQPATRRMAPPERQVLETPYSKGPSAAPSVRGPGSQPVPSGAPNQFKY